MSVQLLSVHLLSFFLLFLLLFLLAILCQVSCLFASETLSFFHQQGSFVDGHCVDVHCVRVFPLGKDKSLVGGVSSSAFRAFCRSSSYSLHSLPRMVEFRCPVIPFL